MDHPSGHLDRAAHAAWSLVFLPWIRAIPRLQPGDANRRFPERNRESGGSDRRASRCIRKTVLEETGMAGVTCLLLAACWASSSETGAVHGSQEKFTRQVARDAPDSAQGRGEERSEGRRGKIIGAQGVGEAAHDA